MSKIYSTSDVVCSCDSHLIATPESSDAAAYLADNTNREWLFEQSPSFRTHQLVDLLFCHHCQRVACENCTSTLVRNSYCPSCMTEQSGTTHCTKNCFECPNCSSSLTMVVLNVTDGIAGPKCKVFKFSCPFCQYQYLTKPIIKPRSLTKILAAESPSLVLFNSYVSKYKDERALRDLNATNNKLLPSHAKRMSGDFLSKLSQLNLSNLTRKFASESSEKEILSERISKIGPLRLEDDDRELIMLTLRQNETQMSSEIPLARRLIPKMAHQCIRCRHELVVPEKSPSLLKFDTRWDAIDLVPTLKASKLAQADSSYLIHVINPSPQSVKITVSSFAKIPSQFVTGDIQIVVKLPGKLLELKGRKDFKREELLKAIPTAYLSESTAASRTELMRRKANITSDRRLSGFEENIEQLENWALIPMHLLFDLEDHVTKVKVPLHLHVQSSTEQGTRLEYSVWSIVTLA